MKLHYRFGVLLILFLVFIAVSPVVILRTFGLQYDWPSHTFLRTGTILARTEPRGAEVYLNDQATGQTTPATIALVPPGDYDIVLVKPGYQKWTKHFSLAPGQVVSLQPDNSPLNLFLTKPAVNLVSTATLELLQSERGRYALTASSSAALLNLDTGTSVNFDFHPAPGAIPTCSVSGTGIFCRAGGDWRFFNLETGQQSPLALHSLLAVKATSLSANRVALLDRNSNLYFYDLATRGVTKIATGVEDMLTSDGTLLYFKNKSLFSQRAANEEPVLVLSKLPTSTDMHLLAGGGGRVFASFDEKLVQLLPTQQPIADSVTYATWHSASETLLYGDNNGFSLWSPRSGQSNVMQRSAGRLGQAFYFPDLGQALYLDQGELKSIEAFDTPARITTSLVKSDQGQIVAFAADASLHEVYCLLADGRLLKLTVR